MAIVNGEARLKASDARPRPGERAAAMRNWSGSGRSSAS